MRQPPSPGNSAPRRPAANAEGSPPGAEVVPPRGTPVPTPVPSAAGESSTTGDLAGAVRLLGAAVLGVTDIVEEMHRTIASLSPPLGQSSPRRTPGITGFVYRTVRGVTRAVVPPAEAALAAVTPLLVGGGGRSLHAEAVRAALNGAYGDHLAASANPLAIPMRFRRNGLELRLQRAALAASIAAPSDRLLVMVHGLCMNDLQWNRAGHDHGVAVARETGHTCLYLHFNSGRHVSVNGREFAARLEELVREWPVPVRELTLIGHSMGGLVSRSACHYALQQGHAWPGVLKRIVFLGTPHHGAPLERAGNHVGRFCEISPYTAPLARIGTVRSAGVKDLRHGNLVDEDWKGGNVAEVEDTRRRVPLPGGVACFVVAADRRTEPEQRGWGPPGDGLVPVASALGHHPVPGRGLRIPAAHQFVGYGMNHFDLLDSAAVFERILRWLRS